MSSEIYTRQNEKQNLERLAAMRHLYASAKKLHTLRSFAVAVIASCSLVSVAYPFLKPYIALLALYTFVDQYLASTFEASKIRTAAQIQEEFDTTVLGIPWNPKIDHPRPEIVKQAYRAFSGDKERLKDWYRNDTPEVPGGLSTLLCMRSNLMWDSDLRRRYAICLTAVTALPIMAVMIWAIMTQQTVQEMLLLLPPCIPLARLVIDSAREHYRIAALKDGMEKQIAQIWDDALRTGGDFHVRQVRDLQDGLYHSRASMALVPDFFYWIHRERMEITMKEVLEEMEKDVTQFLAGGFSPATPSLSK